MATVLGSYRIPPPAPSSIDIVGSARTSKVDDSNDITRYRLLSNIQQGSYGMVYCGLDLKTNTKVAIKTMSKQTKGVSVIARHEISILKKLGNSHPNICSLLNNFETSTHFYLVFEYCEHGDLYDYLKTVDNHLHPNNKICKSVIFKNFIKELISAVNYSHSIGIFHRDIKPENVLIDSMGNVKLTDWGLATICETVYDPCIGTEKYMAPETFFTKNTSKSIKDKDVKLSYNSRYADYWSVGITLIYSIFGVCPFKSATPADANFTNLCRDSTSLLQIYPNMTSHCMSAIVDNLLRPNPVDRDLNKCLNGLLVECDRGLTVEQDELAQQCEPDEAFDVFGMDECIGEIISNNHSQPLGDETMFGEYSTAPELSDSYINSFASEEFSLLNFKSNNLLNSYSDKF